MSGYAWKLGKRFKDFYYEVYMDIIAGINWFIKKESKLLKVMKNELSEIPKKQTWFIKKESKLLKVIKFNI